MRRGESTLHKFRQENESSSSLIQCKLLLNMIIYASFNGSNKNAVPKSILLLVVNAYSIHENSFG